MNDVLSMVPHIPEVHDVEHPVIGMLAQTVTCGEQKVFSYVGDRWVSIAESQVVLNGTRIPCQDVIDLFINKDRVIPDASQKVSQAMVDYIAFHADPGTVFLYRFDVSEKHRVCIVGEDNNNAVF